MPRGKVDPFYLIVADHEQRVFSVEGPMTDDTRWNSAVVRAQDDGRKVTCCSAGSQRATAVADYRREYGYEEVPARSIVRPAGDD